MATFVKVEGLQKLNQALKSLSPRLQNRPMKKALASGGVAFARKVRANARRVDDKTTPKAIYKAVSNRFSPVRTRKNGGSPVQRVTIRPTRQNPVYHWIVVDRGTRRTRAKPFMRQSFDQGQGEATTRTAQTLAKELPKAVR